MDFIIPHWSGASTKLVESIGALSTLRSGGLSAPPYDDGNGGGGLNLGMHVGDRPEDVLKNRASLRHILPAEPVWLSQVHGSVVVDAADATGIPEADASFTDRPGVVCAIQTADCLPVLFCDFDGRTVAAAHAGWRGLAGGVLEHTVERMRTVGAGEIAAWLGPAIGPECFEVGQDVLTVFTDKNALMRGAFKPIPGRPGKFLADIYLLARITLEAAGVTRISGGGFCTVTERNRFYSYRRDKVTGRMASLIWIK